MEGNALATSGTIAVDSSGAHQWGCVSDITKHISGIKTDPQGLTRPPDGGAHPLLPCVDTSSTALEHGVCSSLIRGLCDYPYLVRKGVPLAKQGYGELCSTVRRGLMGNSNDTLEAMDSKQVQNPASSTFPCKFDTLSSTSLGSTRGDIISMP